MTTILLALPFAFAAFCVWLTVRIINRRERWAKWMAVVVVFCAYPLSYGPIHRLDYRGRIPYGADDAVYYFYLPLKRFNQLLFDDPTPFPRVSTPLERYAAFWVEDLWLASKNDIDRMRSHSSAVVEDIGREDAEPVDAEFVRREAGR